METIGAILKSITSNLELLWLVFGHFLEKFGILFISTYSHIVGLHEYVPTCYLGILPN